MEKNLGSQNFADACEKNPYYGKNLGGQRRLVKSKIHSMKNALAVEISPTGPPI